MPFDPDLNISEEMIPAIKLGYLFLIAVVIATSLSVTNGRQYFFNVGEFSLMKLKNYSCVSFCLFS